jgi:GTPase SAR1 family protein
MAKRDNKEQALVDFILKNIRTKTAVEIQNYHSIMGILLNEMIYAGLRSEQINSLPNEFLEQCINNNDVSIEDLVNAGLFEDRVSHLSGETIPSEEEDDEEDEDDKRTDINGDDISTPTSEKEDLLVDIDNNDAEIADIQRGINRKIISKQDLYNRGCSVELVDRLMKYTPMNAIFPKVSELPPLRKNSTDVYFLGMPGSGKSTMLASLFYYANSKGLMKNVVDNSFGNKYKNQLIMGMVQGHLPNSTPIEFINFIPVDVRHLAQDDFQQLNFIDMAGEKFKQVANSGIEEFKAYKNYLNNDNNKCLIFVMDYFESNIVKSTEQDQNLQEVLALLESFEILKKTDAVYLVLTKADLFPEENKQKFCENHVEKRYTNFINSCLDAKKKYKFVMKSFPFSIGPSKFSYILEDCNPETNDNLVKYPKQLLKQLEEDISYLKKGWFK